MTELWTSSRTSGHRYVGRLVLKLLTPAFVYKKKVAIRTFGYTLFNLGTVFIWVTLRFFWYPIYIWGMHTFYSDTQSHSGIYIIYIHFLFGYPFTVCPREENMTKIFMHHLTYPWIVLCKNSNFSLCFSRHTRTKLANFKRKLL